MVDDARASLRSPRFRAVLLAVLVVTTLASAALLGWAVLTRGQAEDEQAQREEVMSIGEQFMRRKETFGPDLLDDKGTMPEYRSRMTELITPKLETSFDDQTQAAEQLVAKSGLESTADVYATAVTSLDADSAEVLVVGDTTFKYTKGQPQTAPFRYQLSLVLTGGTWLVDGFEQASAVQP
jgi:Mce-associated membrane protein